MVPGGEGGIGPNSMANDAGVAPERKHIEQYDATVSSLIVRQVLLGDLLGRGGNLVVLGRSPGLNLVGRRGEAAVAQPIVTEHPPAANLRRVVAGRRRGW